MRQTLFSEVDDFADGTTTEVLFDSLHIDAMEFGSLVVSRSIQSEEVANMPIDHHDRAKRRQIAENMSYRQAAEHAKQDYLLENDPVAAVGATPLKSAYGPAKRNDPVHITAGNGFSKCSSCQEIIRNKDWKEQQASGCLRRRAKSVQSSVVQSPTSKKKRKK